jgi:hypothetical protein
VSEFNAAGEAAIEVLLIGLDNAAGSHALIAELGSLHERDVIRVVEALVIDRDPDKTINASSRTQLLSGEAEQYRQLMRDGLGLQPDTGGLGSDLNWQGRSVLFGPTDARFIGASLPPGRAALAVIFEHRWASGLRRLVKAGGATLLDDEVLTPELLAGAASGRSRSSRP